MIDNSPHSWSDLISKYLQGTITQSEFTELQRQMELSPDKKNQFERYSSADYLMQQLGEMLDYDISRISNKVMVELPEPSDAKVVPFYKTTTFKTAVGLFVIVTSVIIALNVKIKPPVDDDKTMVHHPPVSKTVASTEIDSNPVNDIYPGTYKAIFTLFNGKAFPLDKKMNGIVTRINDQLITTKDGILNFKSKKPLKILVNGLNKLQTPKGGEYTMQLPDGSKVKLNAGSAIRFPTFFSNDKRMVEVEGEAYFDVIKNRNIPFFVKLGNGYTIKVTGTKFNVNAHKDDGITKITLIEGAIQVGIRDSIPSYQYLKQEQQMQIYPDGSTKIIETVNVEEVISWKNEMFNLYNIDLKSFMKQIERWYDVELNFDEAAPNPKLEGAISRNRPLNDVIKVLRDVSGVNIYLKGRKIYVTAKPN